MNYTIMPHVGYLPSVSILGWTILALSLESDHLDFLGWPGDEQFWLTKSFTITYSQSWIISISSAYSGVRVGPTMSLEILGVYQLYRISNSFFLICSVNMVGTEGIKHNVKNVMYYDE